MYTKHNFYYCGAAIAHDCEYIVDGVNVHPRTLAARGITSPKKWAKENSIQIIAPKPKHRYVFFTGNKKDKKESISLCKWPISMNYPKGDTKRYII